MTSNGQFNITVDPEIGGNHNSEVEDPMNKVVYVQDATDLQSALENPNVGGVFLTEDVTLENNLVFGAPGRAATTLPGRDFVIDGNGKTLKVVNKGTGRVIDFTAETNGANLTLKNLTIENQVSWIERIVNYNTGGTLTLDNVKIINAEGCSNNYAINLPASSDNATVVIKDSEIWAGANALNLWGANISAEIIDSKLYVVDNTAAEGYSVVALNNQGENAAHYSTINVWGGEVKVVYEGEGETMPSSAFRDATVGSTINISENTVVVGEIKIPVANVIYEGYNEFYSFTTLQAAIDKAIESNAKEVQLIKDITLDEKITVNGQVTLNLNGKTISGVNNAGQAHMFMVKYGATLTIEDNSANENGKITYAMGTNAIGWAIDVEGKLILNSGTIELTGESWDIAYCVDVRPNAWGTEYTEATVFTMNGGKLVSSFDAIRIASSSSDKYMNVAANFIMNGGEINAARDGIFMQQSNDAYDTLGAEINEGTIMGTRPIRVYGPDAKTVNAGTEKPMTITAKSASLVLVGELDTTYTWHTEGKIAYRGGMTLENLNKYANITLDGTTTVVSAE